MDKEIGANASVHETFTPLTGQLYAYLAAHNRAPDVILRDLAAETRALGSMATWQIAVEQGALLTVLARLTGARRAVEVEPSPATGPSRSLAGSHPAAVL